MSHFAAAQHLSDDLAGCRLPLDAQRFVLDVDTETGRVYFDGGLERRRQEDTQGLANNRRELLHVPFNSIDRCRESISHPPSSFLLHGGKQLKY